MRSVDKPAERYYVKLIEDEKITFDGIRNELLESDERKAAINLLIASRGAPKNKRLMKIFQKQGTQQLIHKMESEFIRDKTMSE